VTIQMYIFHVRHNNNIIKYTIVSANVLALTVVYFIILLLCLT